jgi:hypothetical protein
MMASEETGEDFFQLALDLADEAGLDSQVLKVCGGIRRIAFFLVVLLGLPVVGENNVANPCACV